MTEYCKNCKGIIGNMGLGTYFCKCDHPESGATHLQHLGYMPEILEMKKPNNRLLKNATVLLGGKQLHPSASQASIAFFEAGQRVLARMWIEETDDQFRERLATTKLQATMRRGHEETEIVTLKERNKSYPRCWDAIGDDGVLYLVTEGQLVHLPQNGLTELVDAVKNDTTK